MTGADSWLYLPGGYNKFGKNWWRHWLMLPKRVLRHWVERIIRGYSVYDMWNGEDFLADVIAGTAYWHFVHNHGHPVGMSDQEWREVLLEIRDGFSTRDEFDDLKVPDEAWDLLRKYFLALWD